MTFTTPIEEIPKVGPAFAKRFKQLKIRTLGDLVFYFPRDYQDLSKISKIKDVKINENICVHGKILEIGQERSWRKKMAITKAVVQDDTGSIEVIWFNQPFLIRNLKKDEELMLAGKTVVRDDHLYLSSPTYEKISIQETTHMGRVVPIYPETRGVSSRLIRYILKPALTVIKNKIPETLPQKIREEYGLIDLKDAIYEIHFPSSLEIAKKARERFSFENIFYIALFGAKKKIDFQKEKAPAIPINETLIERFLRSLPFKLTKGQMDSATQILKDMERPFPMNRLLQGDVGSGKTVVSVIASINAIKNKNQVVLMAPTEILAKQHFKTFFQLLKDFNINIGFLTGKEDKYYSKKLKTDTIEISRERMLKKTQEGDIDLLIGTQALIAPKKKTLNQSASRTVQGKKKTKVLFKNLGLVIVDEQHRFGVTQRAALCGKQSDKIPHLLSMTATPIPRTLALTIWGDLDLSIIKEMPQGRKKIITKIATEEDRPETYKFIKEEINKGRQAFVICPRIEAADEENENALDVKAVKEEYEKLSKEIFPDLKIGMLHGKMTPKEKEKTMKDFKNKKFDLLVSTSVVEVGIDVPNATVMMIEGADRFGLAQLHQFRGRVGRSEYQSYCFLLTDSAGLNTKERLKAMIKYDSGFELSEMDLKIRGPGDFVGVRQWGLPDFAMSALKEPKLIERTKKTAEDILTESPDLSAYPILKARLEIFEERIHLE
ncbi:MAG: ATP-dependent DNA helicase RecG [Candidatus Pacebacteria bacterium]|nr:ATP-dependent DNA helicase RecG [Candidatus Paceibacterota bacterium]